MMIATASETTIRRGRPAISAEKRESMENRISETARKLFHTEGYSTVSMRRIASEIGCSPMTLYKYYDAKIDILRTLWSDVFKELFTSLDQFVVNDADPVERLVLLSTAYVDYWLRNREEYRLVFMADGVTQSDVSVFVDNPEIIARYDVLASSILAACPKASDADALKVKLDALICTLHGIAHNVITISNYPWADRRKMIGLVVTGIIDT